MVGNLITLMPIALARGATLSADPATGMFGWVHLEYLVFVLLAQGFVSGVVGQCVWNLSLIDGESEPPPSLPPAMRTRPLTLETCC